MHDVGMNMSQLAMSVKQVDDTIELAHEWSHQLLHATENFDMERIGAQAADIAEITRDIADNSIKDLVPIGDMARATIKMVTDSVDSFVRKDLGLAEAVISSDDVVDDLFLQVREELIRRIGMGDSGEVCIDLLMIAKYLERIGDHAVNIAEWVEYSLTGHHADLP